MTIIFLILPVTLLLSAGAVAAFAWATRSGQFDDLETPGIRLLHEHEHEPHVENGGRRDDTARKPR